MSLGPLEIVAIVLVILLLFGYKKLPDATRSLGRSLRIFKTEVGALREDDAAPAALEAAGPTAEELEAQARAEETRAAELRARLAGGTAA
jgi:sec-independent protein translocase protein TatA